MSGHGDVRGEGTEPTAGILEGKTHVLPVRVYYEETDFTGVVYHANYLRFLERGRTDFLRLLGVHHAELWALSPPLAFTLRALSLAFIKPARVDDALQVMTRYTALKGPSLHARQWIIRAGEKLVEAHVHAVLIDAGGRPKRPPPALVHVLQPFLIPEE